jgi:carbon monoxide dehydrogenase subunit G
MITVERTFAVTAPADVVVGYLADFGNTEQWDPGTQSTERTGDGPVAPGATWHNVSKVMGVTTELTYTLRELGRERIVFVGTNDGATSTDTITVRPKGAGSEITYHVDLQTHGAMRLATPAMKVEFEHLATKTQKQMTEVINGLR